MRVRIETYAERGRNHTCRVVSLVIRTTFIRSSQLYTHHSYLWSLEPLTTSKLYITYPGVIVESNKRGKRRVVARPASSRTRL